MSESVSWKVAGNTALVTATLTGAIIASPGSAEASSGQVVNEGRVPGSVAPELIVHDQDSAYAKVAESIRVLDAAGGVGSAALSNTAETGGSGAEIVNAVDSSMKIIQIGKNTVRVIVTVDPGVFAEAKAESLSGKVNCITTPTNRKINKQHQPTVVVTRESGIAKQIENPGGYTTGQCTAIGKRQPGGVPTIGFRTTVYAVDPYDLTKPTTHYIVKGAKHKFK